MFIRVKTTPNSPRKSVQIVASVRDGAKVKQKIIRHVGIAMNDAELEKLKDVAGFIKSQIEEEHQPSLFSAEESAKQIIDSRKQQATQNEALTVDLKQLKEVQRSITGIHEVYGALYDQLNFGSILGKNKRYEKRREIIKNLTLARIAEPDSKRGTVRTLERDFGIRINLKSAYEAMDLLDDAAIETIQDAAYSSARQLLGEQLDVLFYDCTTLYFESFEPDELRQKGFSKDRKVNETQVLLALLVTRDGIPIGYEVFPGATFEGHTLIPVLSALKKRYQIGRIVFVADRGLFSADNLDCLEDASLEYVVGAKLKTQSAALKNQILALENYRPLNGQSDLSYLEIERPNNRRLIISYSKKRAKKDRYERNKSIEKLKKKLAKVSTAKEFVGSSGYKKYLNIPKAGAITLSEDAIAKSAQWDGLHGVISNAHDESIEDILAHYRGLWQVEESFRIQKHDLKVRPIYHWSESRIRAHLAISFMAFCCVRHLGYRVNLQYKKLSPEVIKRELCHVQVSLLEHQKTKSLYAMPSSVSHDATKIYQVMGMRPTTTAHQVK